MIGFDEIVLIKYLVDITKKLSIKLILLYLVIIIKRS